MTLQRLSCLFGAAGLVLVAGCGTTIKVIPDPTEATIKLDGQEVGHGVTEVALPESENTYQLEVCGPPGYFCKSSDVDGRLGSRTLKIKVPRDLSFDETVVYDVANKWLKVDVASSYEHDDAWKKVVSCVSDAYPDLETLDGKSGYLKTTWKVKDYGYPEQYKLRARLIVGTESSTPLQYKVRLESEYFKGNDAWAPYDRVFRVDHDAVSCIRNRVKR